jgi:hypothetical protein
MAKPVLFLHGAGSDGYSADKKLAASLQAALGEAYTMLIPEMPNPDTPDSDAWQAYILLELADIEGEVLIVGHSLGGSVLLQALSERTVTNPIAGIFLIAVPYWGMEDWEVDEYVLRADFAAHLPDVPLFLYHSRDDEVVPAEHMTLYAGMMPGATVREFDGRDHQFNDDLSPVAADILSLNQHA